jgi:hypothetical protein
LLLLLPGLLVDGEEGLDCGGDAGRGLAQPVAQGGVVGRRPGGLGRGQ